MREHYRFFACQRNKSKTEYAYFKMIVSDESGVLNVVWYNNRYVKNQFKTGDKYVLYGKVTKNRGKLER